MTKFRFIDLFAGIGGFHIALKKAGGECVGFSEIAPDAINAYCSNHMESPSNNLGDITVLNDLPQHEFMTAGVPCQSWSIAGKNLGFDDDRGQLWNDTLYLLKKAQPKAFIFENVKGLSDPRNSHALEYIMQRIKEAGYYAEKYILNAFDYGVPQNRIRIYIIGFKDRKYYDRFYLPKPTPGEIQLGDIISSNDGYIVNKSSQTPKSRWSLSCNERGFNDYFLFNDLRNGSTTIHSWDILETTRREKYICNLLLANRRKKGYGFLDGNPLSLEHFRNLDDSITKEELEDLVTKKILKKINYAYRITSHNIIELSDIEQLILSFNENNILYIDKLKLQRIFKIKKINICETLLSLLEKQILLVDEVRYDFKFSKISTGLFGINRIFLKSSKVYPTLVASDTNDYVATEDIYAENIEEFRDVFLRNIFFTKKYRQITRSEACEIQGFPPDFILPESRPRWMKLIGNSVAVKLIEKLVDSVVSTGVFCEDDYIERHIEMTNDNVVQKTLF